MASGSSSSERDDSDESDGSTEVEIRSTRHVYIRDQEVCPYHLVIHRLAAAARGSTGRYLVDIEYWNLHLRSYLLHIAHVAARHVWMAVGDGLSSRSQRRSAHKHAMLLKCAEASAEASASVSASYIYVGAVIMMVQILDTDGALERFMSCVDTRYEAADPSGSCEPTRKFFTVLVCARSVFLFPLGVWVPRHAFADGVDTAGSVLAQYRAPGSPVFAACRPMRDAVLIPTIAGLTDAYVEQQRRRQHQLQRRGSPGQPPAAPRKRTLSVRPTRDGCAAGASGEPTAVAAGAGEEDEVAPQRRRLDASAGDGDRDGDRDRDRHQEPPRHLAPRPLRLLIPSESGSSSEEDEEGRRPLVLHGWPGDGAEPQEPQELQEPLEGRVAAQGAPVPLVRPVHGT